MYNRYSPQPDGTYKCRSIKSPANIPPPVRSYPEDINDNAPKHDAGNCRSPEQVRTSEPRKQRPIPRQPQEKSAVSFLKELLPKGLDTGDLLIVILLLLMSADSSGEDQGNALLTLALYLFM